MRTILLLLQLAAVVACGKKTSPTTPSDNAVPSYGGSWTGTYAVTSCTNSGFFADVSFCDQVLNSTASVTFTFAQTDRAISGSFQLGSLAFPSFSASVAADGSIAFASRFTDSAFSIEVSWTLRQQTAGALTGQTHQVWTAAGQSGDGVLDGQIVSVGKASSAAGVGLTSQNIKRRTLADIVQATRPAPAR